MPADDLARIAWVGRSNVGKSSLINALVRARVARTSATPGKTRLANLYRVARGSARPVYFIDLPGYGFAVGQRGTGRASGGGSQEPAFEAVTRAVFDDTDPLSGLLLVDARHPGLESDRNAWQWLQSSLERRAIVATKVDKLARGQRIRALRELESVFEDSVLPVSAVTGEGIDELWKLIDRLANSPNTHLHPSRPTPPKATALRQTQNAPAGPKKPKR